MKKLWRLFEYGYLIIAIVFFVEAILRWNTDRNKAYLFVVFTIVAVFMYFFKKRFRRKIEERNKK